MRVPHCKTHDSTVPIRCRVHDVVGQRAFGRYIHVWLHDQAAAHAELAPSSSDGFRGLASAHPPHCCCPLSYLRACTGRRRPRHQPVSCQPRFRTGSSLAHLPPVPPIMCPCHPPQCSGIKPFPICPVPPRALQKKKKDKEEDGAAAADGEKKVREAIVGYPRGYQATALPQTPRRCPCLRSLTHCVARCWLAYQAVGLRQCWLAVPPAAACNLYAGVHCPCQVVLAFQGTKACTNIWSVACALDRTAWDCPAPAPPPVLL